MDNISEKFRVGVLPGIANLYSRAWPELEIKLSEFIKETAGQLGSKEVEVFYCKPASTLEAIEAGCRELEAANIDLLIVALALYCPSGAMAPALVKVRTPLLLWPVQGMYELTAEGYDWDAVLLNHGVHAVQDLANLLGKSDKAFGVIHGHLQQADFREEMNGWIRAGRAIVAMGRSNPVQIGGHFEDMLDLQVGEEKFVRKMGLKPEVVTQKEFAKIAASADRQSLDEYIRSYKETFDIGGDVDGELLEKTARGHFALDKILKKHKSSACGLNFLELCNDEHIADGLHAAASVFMAEGGGYAGEGDWVTAAFLYGAQQGLGMASFSEMFSVGYGDNRVALKHWGEGNFKMSRNKPKMIKTELADRYKAVFTAVDFEFKPGRACLININCDANGQGRLITVSGTITDDHLPKVGGPRAVFKPDAADVREMLTDYAYNGGSHHLVLAEGDCGQIFKKIARLSGWQYIEL